jgi:hypothetical protein
LNDGKVPEDKKEEHKLRTKALQYEVIEGSLYRKSYLGPSLKCVDMAEASYIIKELHEGMCGAHAGPKSDSKKGHDGWVLLAINVLTSPGRNSRM